MKKVTLMLLLLAGVTLAMAQVEKVSIQASGLTCSMCSNAINKALQTIDAVEKVTSNIKNSSFDVTFKKDGAVDFDKLKAKVEDAGFFVSRLSAVVQFDNIAVSNDEHVFANGYTFHFLNVKYQTLTGSNTIRLLDKGFVSAKEYKKNSSLTKKECYKTGIENGNRIFHVTL